LRGTVTSSCFSVIFISKNSLLCEMVFLLLFLSLFAVVKVILSIETFTCSIAAVSIHFLKIVAFLLILPRLITVTSLFLESNRTSSCAMLRAIAYHFLLGCLILDILHKFVGMLLKWSWLNLTFSELFSWSHSSCRYSFHRYWSLSFNLWSSCLIIIGIEVVKQ